MTATAVLFPGLNAIFRERDRHRYDALPSVRNNFRRLEEFGFQHELSLDSTTLLEEGRYTGIAAVSLAIQCGAYRELEHRGVSATLLAGCSLGDLARSICSGALSLDETLQTLAFLTEPLRTLESNGKTIALRLPQGQRITTGILDDLHAAGFEPSILSARHMTIGCDEEGGQVLKKMCSASAWHFTDTQLPFALHSQRLVATVNSFAPLIKLTPCSLITPVFSSVQLRRLDTWKEVIADGYKVFSTPVQWPQALSCLRSAHGITRFINIGPCNSLTLLARETDRSIRIEPAGQHFNAIG